MIRWITEELGTAPFTSPEISGELNVLDVRDLVDKHGNSSQATREKIDQGVALLQQGGRLVVCCDYGISRSNAIAAGILSVKSGITLEAAVRQVMRATGEQEIKLDPLRAVRAALSKPEEDSGADEPRVLITGGSGFIGSCLQEVLGDQVYWVAPTRSEADLISGALELDLLVKEHRINCIVHLANPRVYTSIQAIGDTVTLLRNVLEVCKENHIRLIYPSGWEVYSGYRSSDLIADESLPAFAKGPYGEAKALCESLIEHHRKLHGLQCGMLRSSPLYGATSDRPKFIYNFIGKALRGETIKTHRYLNGDPKLDLLHVDDFVSAIVSAVRTNFSGTVNIGAGHAVSTKTVAEWIVSKIGSNSVVESRGIEDYVANITMDISSAQQHLSWQPVTEWEVGLAQLLESAIDPEIDNEEKK